MTILNKVSSKTLMPGITPIPDVPDAPTIGAATAVDYQSATVAFTAAATGGAVTTYTATSTPGSITATGSSPITVSGLTDGTAYTFTVKGTNATATGPNSSASNSVTTPVSPSFQSIATVTVGAGGTSTVTFSSIPSTYKHLQIKAFARSTRSAANSDGPLMRLGNGSVDTGSNYSWHFVKGDGSATGANGYANQTQISMGDIPASTATANAFGVFIIDILDYENTNKYKTTRGIIGHDRDSAGDIRVITGSWRSTSAVNTISLFPETGPNFAQYSHFALYGIKG